MYTSINVICVLLLCAGSVVAAVPKRPHTDLDGLHSYYQPVTANNPDAWRDWINPPGQNKQDWYQLGQDAVKDSLKKVEETITKPAKNVIVFVGDGMGLSTVAAARILKAQSRKVYGDDAYLSFETLPYTGLSRVYATDQFVPDSANTATAIFGGVKTKDGIVGGDDDVLFQNCSSMKGNEVESVLRLAINDGKVAGVVSTTRITHATPAATYAHSADRDWEADSNLNATDIGICEDIASQLITEERNQNIRVILGGGRYNFMTVDDQDPEYPDVYGRRDDMNLLQDWQRRRADEGLLQGQYSLVYNKTDFDNVDEETTEYLMGLFEPGHMQYEADREDFTVNNWAEPSIEEMTEKAIKILRKNEEGYFLVVEGGRIDTAHHDTKAHKAMIDTLAFQDAVEKAVEMTDEQETLIIVTADHSHVFTIAGYGGSNSDILTYDDEYRRMTGDDDKLYMTLGYTNGPGYDFHRRQEDGTEMPRRDLSELTIDQIRDKNFEFDAGIPRYSETHAGEDVGIWAQGPMAHLFQGTVEQSYIAHVIMYAMCVGPNQDLCEDVVVDGASTITATNTLLTVSLSFIVSIIFSKVR